MSLSSLTSFDQRALASAMRYWEDHWDFECPVLFGLELEELRRVLARWPLVPQGDEQLASIAVVAALRELLYGASAVPKAKVPACIGLSFEEAHLLCERVHSMVLPPP